MAISIIACNPTAPGFFGHPKIRTMSEPITKILLTGFGPFPGVPRNMSAELVTALADAVAPLFPNLAITAAILPTNWRQAPTGLFKLLNEQRPDLALHFGVADGATGFAIETRARNLTCEQHDDAGELPALDCLQVGGPRALSVDFDAELLAAQLRSNDIAARSSDDAGAYLCNAVLYQSLLFAKDHAPAMIAGFIHIPDQLDGAPAPGATRSSVTRPTAALNTSCDQCRDAAKPALSWEAALAGGSAIIASLLQTSAAPE